MTQRKLVPYGFGNKNIVDIRTPKDLYLSLNEEFGPFGKDPCPIGGTGGLEMEWDDRTFVNPPYDNVTAWVIKAIKERNKGKLVVMLVPARVNTEYWFKHVWPNVAEIRFFRSVTFEGYPVPSPMPICLLIFKPHSSVSSYHATKDGKYKWFSVKRKE
jgi:hypothetical protein